MTDDQVWRYIRFRIKEITFLTLHEDYLTASDAIPLWQEEIFHGDGKNVRNKLLQLLIYENNEKCSKCEKDLLKEIPNLSPIKKHLIKNKFLVEEIKYQFDRRLKKNNSRAYE